VEYGGKLLSQGNTQQAIGAFSEATKLSPNDVNAHLGLAKSFLKNGDFLKALQVAQEALRLDPANKDIQSLFQELRK
jgi:Flp pilus assembly protein TadD